MKGNGLREQEEKERRGRGERGEEDSLLQKRLHLRHLTPIPPHPTRQSTIMQQRDDARIHRIRRREDRDGQPVPVAVGGTAASQGRQGGAEEELEYDAGVVQ